VYVATFAPDAHEVVTAYGGKYPSRLNSALRPDSAGFLTVDRAQFQELFASLCLRRWPCFNGPHIMSLVAPQPEIANDFASRRHCSFWASR